MDLNYLLQGLDLSSPFCLMYGFDSSNRHKIAGAWFIKPTLIRKSLNKKGEEGCLIQKFILGEGIV